MVFSLLHRAITPNFWRAPTDNDFGNGMPRTAKIWKESSEKRSVNYVRINGQAINEIKDAKSLSEVIISTQFNFAARGIRWRIDYQFGPCRSIICQ